MSRSAKVYTFIAISFFLIYLMVKPDFSEVRCEVEQHG